MEASHILGSKARVEIKIEAGKKKYGKQAFVFHRNPSWYIAWCASMQMGCNAKKNRSK
jgi:hypothetical protein